MLATSAAECHAAAELLLRASTRSMMPAARPLLLIDMACQQSDQQQNCRLLKLMSINGTDRRMDA